MLDNSGQTFVKAFLLCLKDKTYLTSAIPAVFRFHPQLFVPVHQAIGAAGPLAVTALQLGQSRLCVVQLHTESQKQF